MGNMDKYATINSTISNDSGNYGLTQTENMRALLEHLGQDLILTSYHQFYNQHQDLSGKGELIAKLISVAPFSGFSLVPSPADALHVREARNRPEINDQGALVFRAAPRVRRTVLISKSFVALHSMLHSIKNQAGQILYDSPIKNSPVPGTFSVLAVQDAVMSKYKSELFGESYVHNPSIALEWMLDYVFKQHSSKIDSNTLTDLTLELPQIYLADSPIHGMKPCTLESKSNLAVSIWHQAKAASSLKSDDYLNKSLYQTIASVSHQILNKTK
jgi:hypothetical protein